jgi:hypothetical protein
MGGLGGCGLGMGLGRTLGTGAGVNFARGVVPVESLLTPLGGTGLFLAMPPVRLALQPSSISRLTAAASPTLKTDFRIRFI